ncbi:cellulose synthase operon protein YhjQ/BcsQ [uncultured Jannaschia sp.]|uniref:nucleotide-binding protein n=1 Tax=uncultured Jannaschia sp. TaxID=293347 RepID=UPI00262C524C|nr:cellulose synthase operon protein YhjQ/BcsQ [uncultured Jannaschia sp.]
MHTISIFGLKEGTGRSTLTMALAAALVAKNYRVLIVDATDGTTTRRDVSLEGWVAHQHRDGTAEDALEVCVPDSDDSLENLLTGAAWRGIGITLVDTGARLNAYHTALAQICDLVLVPFISEVDARAVTGQLTPAGDTAPLFGVEVCVSRNMLWRSRALESFGGVTLQTTLSRSDVFARMPGMGRLDRRVAALDDPEAEDAPGLFEATDMRHAWTEAQELATEVVWMLKGYMLEYVCFRDAPTDPQASGSGRSST